MFYVFYILFVFLFIINWLFTIVCVKLSTYCCNVSVWHTLIKGYLLTYLLTCVLFFSSQCMMLLSCWWFIGQHVIRRRTNKQISIRAISVIQLVTEYSFPTGSLLQCCLMCWKLWLVSVRNFNHTALICQHSVIVAISQLKVLAQCQGVCSREFFESCCPRRRNCYVLLVCACCLNVSWWRGSKVKSLKENYITNVVNILWKRHLSDSTDTSSSFRVGLKSRLKSESKRTKTLKIDTPAYYTLSPPPPSPSITPSLFHSRLKTHLFLKSFPP